MKIYKMEKVNRYSLRFEHSDVWSNTIFLTPVEVIELYNKLGHVAAEIIQERADEKEEPNDK